MRVSFVKAAGLTLLAVVATGCLQTEPMAEMEDVKLPWIKSYSEAMTAAKKNGKPVFIKFTADWCGPCKEMKKGMGDKRMAGFWPKMNLVEVDIDLDANQKIVEKYHPEGSIPFVLILRPDGSRVSDQLGYDTVASFEKFVSEALKKG